MSDKRLIETRLILLARRPFRAKFHLGQAERAMIEQKGLLIIRHHADELIAKRLAPAAPLHDGKQTPYKGHPVFIAQHATATCCRSCLERWHTISKGFYFTSEQQMYVVEVIITWIKREIGRGGVTEL